MSRERTAPPPTVVELAGGIATDLADHARAKVDAVLAHTGRPLLHSRVRVVRHGDPGRERPVTAQVTIDLDGRPLRVHTAAGTPREAVDLLVDRLDRRLERIAPHRDHRRPAPGADAPAGPRRRYDRPAEECEVVRHKTVSPARCTVDRAVAEMEDLDYDFHLFVESQRGVDSVVHRDGTGIGLIQLDGGAGRLAPGAVPVTASPLPAPELDLSAAVQRLRCSGEPFLFYLDADYGRGCLLYQRYDGHYGLIDPLAAQNGAEDDES